MMNIKEADSIMISNYPKYNKKHIFADESIRLEKIMKDIIAIRNMKANNNITKDSIVDIKVSDEIRNIYLSQLKIKEEQLCNPNQELLSSNYKSELIDITYYYHGEENKNNIEEEIKKLEASIARRKKLLSNENYVNKAPKNIVDLDRKKLEEEENRLSIIKNNN